METIGLYKLIRPADGSPDNENLFGSTHVRQVEELLKQGEKHIAITLEGSREQPHSRQVSLLMQCIRKVESAGGSFAAIIPDETLFTLLIEMGVPNIIRIFKTEKEMRLKYS